MGVNRRPDAKSICTLTLRTSDVKAAALTFQPLIGPWASSETWISCRAPRVAEDTVVNVITECVLKTEILTSSSHAFPSSLRILETLTPNLQESTTFEISYLFWVVILPRGNKNGALLRRFNKNLSSGLWQLLSICTKNIVCTVVNRLEANTDFWLNIWECQACRM